jgi:hypothetical protein
VHFQEYIMRNRPNIFARARGRWAALATLILIATYVGTLITAGRWYGKWMVGEEGNGSMAIYWGGDKGERDSAVYNAGEWPLRPGTSYAGSEPPGWEFYGPSVELSPEANGDIVGWEGWRNRLELKWPWYFSKGGERSVVMPMPVMMVIVAGLWLGRAWRGRRNSKRGFPVVVGVDKGAVNSGRPCSGG